MTIMKVYDICPYSEPKAESRHSEDLHVALCHRRGGSKICHSFPLSSSVICCETTALCQGETLQPLYCKCGCRSKWLYDCVLLICNFTSGFVRVHTHTEKTEDSTARKIISYKVYKSSNSQTV